jgi:hypothetical protein
MSTHNCTILCHIAEYEAVANILRTLFPKGTFEESNTDEARLIKITLKSGFLAKAKVISISFRERKISSFRIKEIDSPLTESLFQLANFVTHIPGDNKLKRLIPQKIHTVNTEVAIVASDNSSKEFSLISSALSETFMAIVFCPFPSAISQSDTQHFLNHRLELLLDSNGKSISEDINCEIDMKKFRVADMWEVSEEAKDRKQRSDIFLQDKGVKLNNYLPCIEISEEAKIRTPLEIAERFVALTVINFVAFEYMTSDEALDYLSKHSLTQLITPDEAAFLDDATPEKRIQKTWQLECVWTLFWALNIAADLDFPDHLADLNKIPQQDFPLGKDKDPRQFIERFITRRSDTEILDAADLYYRFDWACVNARINNEEVAVIHPSVVYERHYALNWLIGYMGVDWDDVSADT